MGRKDSQRLFRSQLDRQLRPLVRAQLSRPRNGWTKAVRTAIGMSTRQLATRMGITQSRVSKIEKAEVEGAVTLATLERTARALDCRLVYAFVPQDGSLEGIVRAQARAIAMQLVGRVTHSMALESQEVSAAFRKRQIEELVDELVREMPRSLWEAK